MHSTFLSLKARNKMTLSLDPEEFNLKGERKLFQARIKDDDYKHSLIVYEDRATRSLRLHAAVWDGELRQCPVWTAFVTQQSTHPKWLKRVSDLKIHLTDIQPYVFCRKYRAHSMRVGENNEFELYFVSAEAADRFEELFTEVTREVHRPRLDNQPAVKEPTVEEPDDYSNDESEDDD